MFDLGTIFSAEVLVDRKVYLFTEKMNTAIREVEVSSARVVAAEWIIVA